MVEKIVNNDISSVLESEVAVIDFSAQWCGPCRMLEPVLEELAEELEGKVKFFNADVDENMVLAMEHGISSIPAIMVFRQGKKVDFTVGFTPKDELSEFIQAYI